VQVGDLVKINCVPEVSTTLNRITALYLGEDFIHRDDGVVVENHKILVLGETTPTIIDQTVLRWITVIK
jgi:hypothetical protein